jgi:hypothetical protein
MEQQKAIKPQAYENLLTSLKSDYHRLMVATNGSWYSSEDREAGRLALAKSLENATNGVRELEGTPDAELRRLHDQLLIQATLSEDAVKHPGTLKR